MFHRLLFLGLLFLGLPYAQGQINEFAHLGPERKIEYKLIGLTSGPLNLIIYDANGLVMDTIPFSAASSVHGGVEWDRFVEYYVFENQPIPDSGAIALAYGENLTIYEFLCFYLTSPLVALNGPAQGQTATLLPISQSVSNQFTHSLQLIENNWYASPKTFGLINHIGCPNADTTIIDTMLCPGEYFDCGLILYTEPAQCIRTLVGSDDCDSTIIYNIDVMSSNPIDQSCIDGPCILDSNFYTVQSIQLDGHHQITSGSSASLIHGTFSQLGPGFEVCSGAVLKITRQGCE